MPRKQTPAQARQTALESEYTPLYAVAGLTDALADALRSALVETQYRALKGLTDLSSRGPALQQQALTNAEEARTFVITLPEQFLHLPEATKARVAELQTQANDLLAQATATYAELAGRGKLVVDDAVNGARGLSAQTEKRVDDLREEAGDRVDPLLEQVQETMTRARKNVSGRTATETVTPRSAAKSAATQKSAAAKRAAAQDAAKKAAEVSAPATKKKASAAKKAADQDAAQEARTRRAPAKKAAAKKAVSADKPVVENAVPAPQTAPTESVSSNGSADTSAS